MSKDEATNDKSTAKRSKLPILVGLLLALVLGGVGFYATYSGMLGGAAADQNDSTAKVKSEAEPETLGPISFVAIEPLVVSLSNGGSSTFLRFRGNLEVAAGQQEAVTSLMPRVMDVLNGYLRALEVTEIEDPSALIRLRAQMLRRVQLVVGNGMVHDLLVTEFVLN
jgi:flagellar FliL protein